MPLSLIASSLLGVALGASTLLPPPQCSSCTDIAIVWISGPGYSPSDYVDIATAF